MRVTGLKCVALAWVLILVAALLAGPRAVVAQDGDEPEEAVIPAIWIEDFSSVLRLPRHQSMPQLRVSGGTYVGTVRFYGGDEREDHVLDPMGIRSSPGSSTTGSTARTS